ncbi:MAG: hypothetical protein AVDCRST_MAG59-981 [uncultured Thermomicrobiales bacterium]|uniref:Uncharacterized protein n=1 Tax=uncultured Thermomicrobiales bacterium TaxID=1645740 RepID=A0A6J4U9Z5_9BACT|nr:MAG: hypothetical protein AVDCRST_MAG59-981 [uncultured Thermomicrobiales bacterium]
MTANDRARLDPGASLPMRPFPVFQLFPVPEERDTPRRNGGIGSPTFGSDLCRVAMLIRLPGVSVAPRTGPSRG